MPWGIWGVSKTSLITGAGVKKCKTFFWEKSPRALKVPPREWFSGSSQQGQPSRHSEAGCSQGQRRSSNNFSWWQTWALLLWCWVFSTAECRSCRIRVEKRRGLFSLSFRGRNPRPAGSQAEMPLRRAVVEQSHSHEGDREAEHRRIAPWRCVQGPASSTCPATSEHATVNISELICWCVRHPLRSKTSPAVS